MSLSHSQPNLRSIFAAALLTFACGCQTTKPPPEPQPIDVSEVVSSKTPDSRLPTELAPQPSRVVSTQYDLAARYSAIRAGTAMVVVEGDQIALAVGQNGHVIDEPHPIHNATESFWGVAAIAAEIDGLLDLDEPVSFTLTEFAGMDRKQDIRIRQLLWYTSGLEAGVWPLIRDKPRNQLARSLTLESVAAPGARFQYGPSHLAVFGELLRRILEPEGIDAVAYLTQRILNPIGLTVSDWGRDPVGNPDLAGGATLTATEWSKFGRLLRDDGRWGGESIIDPNELQSAFVGSEVEANFGLALWVNPTQSGAVSSGGPVLPDYAMAAGSGNQRMYVIPSLDLVVVRLGRPHRDWRDREFLALLVSTPRP